MQIYGIIYKATNIINGKSYIGQTTKTIQVRINCHVKHALSKKTNFIFHKAIRKYGIQNFDIQKIDIAYFKQQLNEKQKYYITKFDCIKNGYNMTQGGNGGNIYQFLSEQKKLQIKQKIKQKRLKWLQNDENKNKWKMNLSIANKNNKKLINSLTGRQLSLQHKMSISNGIQNALLDDNKRDRISHRGCKKVFTQQHKHNLSKASIGKEKSQMHKKNLSKAILGKKRCCKCHKYFMKNQLINKLCKLCFIGD